MKKMYFVLKFAVIVVLNLAIVCAILFVACVDKQKGTGSMSPSITDFDRSNERDYNAQVREQIGLDNFPALTSDQKLYTSPDAERLSITPLIDVSSPRGSGSNVLDFSVLEPPESPSASYADSLVVDTQGELTMEDQNPLAESSGIEIEDDNPIIESRHDKLMKIDTEINKFLINGKNEESNINTTLLYVSYNEVYLNMDSLNNNKYNFYFYNSDGMPSAGNIYLALDVMLNGDIIENHYAAIIYDIGLIKIVIADRDSGKEYYEIELGIKK